MNLEVHFREMESTEPLREAIAERAQKLASVLEVDEHVTLILGAKLKGHRHFAEIYWHDHSTGKDLVLKKEGSNLYAQIDDLFEAAYAKVHRVHQRKSDRLRKRTPLKKAITKSKKASR